MKITSKAARAVLSELGRRGDREKKAQATRNRMATLTAEERSELARKAGKASAAARRVRKEASDANRTA